jgi:hypothetical protein
MYLHFSESASLGGALVDENPDEELPAEASAPPSSTVVPNVTVHVHPPGSDKSKSRSGSGDSSQNTNMTDSQEWEKIDDSEVKKINPDDVKESDLEPEYDDILGSGQILKKVRFRKIEKKNESISVDQPFNRLVMLVNAFVRLRC